VVGKKCWHGSVGKERIVASIDENTDTKNIFFLSKDGVAIKQVLDVKKNMRGYI
jgi:hypothetical protein